MCESVGVELWEFHVEGLVRRIQFSGAIARIWLPRIAPKMRARTWGTVDFLYLVNESGILVVSCKGLEVCVTETGAAELSPDSVPSRQTA